MKLLSTLRAGIRGYENGTARVYARGGITEVQYYQDFEGQSAVEAGTVIDLDENGAALVYVDQLVTVQVWDENGVELAPFVEGDSADAVELISVGAVGADYETAETGTLKPTTVKAQFDLWFAQNAAAFPKVLLGGVERTILSVLGTLLPETFNVKATTYAGGAVGDGVSDDSAAIFATVAAAAVTGGVVYFPPGTYVMTADLEIPPNVSLLGDGPSVTFLRFQACQAILSGHASEFLVQYVNGLSFDFSATHTEQLLTWEQNVVLICDRCTFNALHNSRSENGLVGATDNGAVSYCYAGFQTCSFNLASSSETSVQDGIDTWAIDANKQEVDTLWCDFQYRSSMGAGYAVNAKGPKLYVRNTAFNVALSTTISGTTRGIRASDGGIVNGCLWFEPSSLTGTYHCIELPTADSTEVLTEGANSFGSGNNPTTFLPYYGPTEPGGYLQSRDQRYLISTGDDDAAFTADLLNFGSIVHERTNVGDQVISIAMGPAGARGRLTVDNGAAGTVNFRWGSNITGLHDFEQLLTGEVGTYEFEFYDDSGTVKARQIGQDDGIVGTLRVQQSGLSAATVNHDFDIDSIWAGMPAASRFRIEIKCGLRDGGDGKNRMALATVVTSGGALSSLVDNGGFGDTGITPSISGGNLRIAGTAGSGNISAMQTQVTIVKVIP